MAQKLAGVDKFFLFISLFIIAGGFLIFSSAALGLLAKESSNYSSVAFSQSVLGLLLGLIFLVLAAYLNFKIWRKLAFWLLLGAIISNLLLFVPGLGLEHGGATRWLSLFGIVSFQPAEFLKFAFIIYFAAWCASAKGKIDNFKSGLLPLLILFAISAGLLIAQPDTGNLFLIALTGTGMYIVAGGKWRHVLLIALMGAVLLGALAYTKPYIKNRLLTFINPQTDSQGISYQVRQSLIAIGSGGLTGQGFGQSVQKFTYLPEPVSDSIFAVVGEELGFIGATTLILVFAIFAMRGLKIASRVNDQFGRLTIVGIVIMIIGQSFFNIGAMLGVLPLSGITLPFVSQGGTSLFFSLLEVGVILSISRTQKV